MEESSPSSFSISTLTKVVFLVKEKIQYFSFPQPGKFPGGGRSLPIPFIHDIKKNGKRQEVLWPREREET
jgi:hypothetical protein